MTQYTKSYGNTTRRHTHQHIILIIHTTHTISFTIQHSPGNAPHTMQHCDYETYNTYIKKKSTRTSRTSCGSL